MLSVSQRMASCKEPSPVALPPIEPLLPVAVLQQVAERHRKRGQRNRCFDLPTVLWLMVASALYGHTSWRCTLLQLWPLQRRPPSEEALAYRRKQLGGAPLQDLFHTLCLPLATADTPGAFWRGYRLMALDGSVDNVRATPANAAAYPAKHTQRGPSAFPQVLGVYVLECGTHAILDVGFWPGTASEHPPARRLVRSLDASMLVLWDRGFHSAALLHAVSQRGAAVLGRLPAHVTCPCEQRLPDGSFLSHLAVGRQRRRELPVRIVDYRVGTLPPIRLVTTLLDSEQAPAHELAALYHQRWEIELAFDEIKTHLVATPVVSGGCPRAVVQELYARLIAHYLVRSLVVQAAQSTGQDPDRLSFTAAVQLVRRVGVARSGNQWRLLLQRVGQQLLPARCVRSSPRVVRRSRSKYLQRPPDSRGGSRHSGTYVDRLQILSLF